MAGTGLLHPEKRAGAIEGQYQAQIDEIARAERLVLAEDQNLGGGFQVLDQLLSEKAYGAALLAVQGRWVHFADFDMGVVGEVVLGQLDHILVVLGVDADVVRVGYAVEPGG